MHGQVRLVHPSHTLALTLDSSPLLKGMDRDSIRHSDDKRHEHLSRRKRWGPDPSGLQPQLSSRCGMRCGSAAQYRSAQIRARTRVDHPRSTHGSSAYPELVTIKGPYTSKVLTEREQQIVDLVRLDPLIGAELLAATLGTSQASINVHISNLRKKGVILGRGYVLAERPGAVVIGGANVDLKARSAAKATPRTSNPGHGSMTPGGVGRNIAENMARLGDRVHLVSVVGRDAMGDNLVEHTAAAGVRVEYVARTDGPTGTYTAVLDVDGELIVAVSDMTASAELGPEQIQNARDVIATAGILVLDGNLTEDAFEYALDLSTGVRTVFEPVSVPKATALSHVIGGRVYAVTPNRDELAALTDLPTGNAAEIRKAALDLHDRGIELVWIRLGRGGSILSTTDRIVEIPAVATTVEDVTGAGDSMVGAFCHALLEGGSPEEAARFGHAAAALTVASSHTVRPDLTKRLVEASLDQEVLK